MRDMHICVCFVSRLTPPLAVMVLVQLSLIDHLGTGPLWDTTNNLLTEMCDENWWSALLYVQNYVSGNRMVRASDMTSV